MALDPALRARIESVLAANPVVLFLKGTPDAPQCGFSAKTAAAMDATGADYAHVNVLADPEIREGIKAYGDWPTIPQLYIGGELVGGSDIVTQMAASGELHAALGVPAPDRTPPSITITPAAAEMLKQALANAGEGYALQVEVDKGYNARLQLAPVDEGAIASESAGIRAQFDLVSAQRARRHDHRLGRRRPRQGPGDRQSQRAAEGEGADPGAGARARAGRQPGAGGRASGGRARAG